MIDYLRQYLIKYFIITAGAIILLTSIVAVVFNIFLPGFERTLEKDFHKYFGHDLAINKSYYLPPNSIILKEISFVDRTNSGKEIISIDSVRFVFSLSKFLRKRSFTATNIYVRRPKANYFSFKIFWSWLTAIFKR